MTGQTADHEYASYLSECGFDASEVEQKMSERLQVRFSMKAKSMHVAQPRNITCSTYEAAQKRLFSSVASFVSGKAGV